MRQIPGTPAFFTTLAALFLGLGIRGADSNPTQDPDKKNSNRDTWECSLRLKNGSFVRGTVKSVASIHLKTRYGVLTIPIKEVRSIRWGRIAKEERDSVDTTEGTYKGWIEKMPTLAVETGFGVLKIPAQAIRTLEIWRKGEGFRETFGSQSLNRWVSKTGTWKVTGGTLQTQGSGNYNNALLYRQDPGERYSLEVDIQSNNTIGVVWHVQADQSKGVALWMYPNQGTIYVFGGQQWGSTQLGTWKTTYKKNQLNHVKLDIDRARVTVWLNDKRIGTVTNATFKKGKVGLFSWGGRATFDNFRIQRR